jgi:hypothetical protein
MLHVALSFTAEENSSKIPKGLVDPCCGLLRVIQDL